jgi:uncharacterized protein (TIGR00369 family)
MTTRSLEPSTLLRMMPLAGFLGIVLDDVRPEAVRGHLAWRPELCTVAGVLHGGVLTTLADSMAGICAYANLPDGAATSTIELKTNFFAAVRRGEVRAVARPLHLARTVFVLQTDLYADDGAGSERPVAQVTQTQAVLG